MSTAPEEAPRTGQRPTAPVGPPLPSAVSLARGLALLRGFLGLVFLLNGLAKLFEFHAVTIGPYVANLIDRSDTRFILNIEANKNVLGLLSRLGALLGLLQVGFLAALYVSNDRWVFEQPLEVVPLLLLVWLPSGRVWGLDGTPGVQARLRGRWPS